MRKRDGAESPRRGQAAITDGHPTRSFDANATRMAHAFSVVYTPSPWELRLMRLCDSMGGVILGLAIGILAAIMVGVISICMPMLSRRARMSATRQPSEITLMREDPGMPDGDERRLPPIRWDLVFTDEQRANRLALKEDISPMAQTSSSNFFEWPVLPYPIERQGDENRYEMLAHMIDGVFDEEPELTVYTNGENLGSVVDFAKYHLVDAEADSTEKNAMEYEAVVQAANEVHAEVEAELSELMPSGLVPPECSENMAYVMLLYRKLSSMSTYSDEVGDTEHNNDIYGALIEGESKCYGVACAAKAVLNRRGIPSFMGYGNAYGDEERRHAWVIMWIDGGWHVLDITYGQGQPAPDVIYFPAALQSQGYWRGCLSAYDEYIAYSHMVTDKGCEDLMRAYEREIGA